MCRMIPGGPEPALKTVGGPKAVGIGTSVLRQITYPCCSIRRLHVYAYVKRETMHTRTEKELVTK